MWLVGVVIASKLSLHCERLLQNEYLNLEFVCVKYQLVSQLVIIYCLYIPPYSALEIYRSHLDAIKSISQELNAKVIILGVFNLPEIKWILSEANDRFVPVNIRSEEAVHTCDYLARYGFSQMNIIPNHYGNVLDLVFTNDPSIASFFKSSDPLSKVDKCHYPFNVFVECLEFNDSANNSSETTYAFYKTDFRTLNEFISNNGYFSMFINEADVNSVIDKIYNVLKNGLDRFVPKKEVKTNNHPPWFNRNLIKLKNRRNKLHKRIKSSVSNLNSNALNNLRLEYEIVKNDFGALQNFLYQNFMLDIESNLKSNPKQFWSYVALKKDNSSLPSKMSFNGISSD